MGFEKSCAPCVGQGFYGLDGRDTCKVCGGKGAVTLRGNEADYKRCSRCSGQGYYALDPSDTCETCKGLGVIEPSSPVMKTFGALNIHPDVAAACERLVEDGYYANAVEDACKALHHLVQTKSGRTASGTPLMETVFSPQAPILKVADVNTQTGRDEQKGTMFMFAGAMLGLRNPRAHSLRVDDAERAIEYIAFISMLAKIADAATT